MSEPAVLARRQSKIFAWQFATFVAVHVVLLVLASTAFTVITGKEFQVQFFRCGSEEGFGTVYQSKYSLPVVITYIAAYGAGIVVYVAAWGRGWRKTAAAGSLLCLVGFLSFALELTHWLIPHNRSLIISFPVVLWILAGGVLIFESRRPAPR